tara:strand:- start:266 stop:487 length:222 start_codon:yes stop_codon:yes gene_type:complete
MKGYYLKQLFESMMNVTKEAIKIVVDELEGNDKKKANAKLFNENKDMIKTNNRLMKEMESLQKQLDKVAKENK